MSESHHDEKTSIRTARVDRVDILDGNHVLAMFSNGQTVIIDREKFKKFALEVGRIVESE
jgi:hypothetical protein